jgi:hypothetical protein
LFFGNCFCTFGAIAFCFSSVLLAFGTYIKLSGVLVFFPWLFLLFCERWSPSLVVLPGSALFGLASFSILCRRDCSLCWHNYYN